MPAPAAVYTCMPEDPFQSNNLQSRPRGAREHHLRAGISPWSWCSECAAPLAQRTKRESQLPSALSLAIRLDRTGTFGTISLLSTRSYMRDDLNASRRRIRAGECESQCSIFKTALCTSRVIRASGPREDRLSTLGTRPPTTN